MNKGQLIGLITAMSLILGNTIGSGIFTTSGFLVRDIGHPSLILWLWALGGAIVLFGSLAYTRLHRLWPESGGEFVYIHKGWGRAPAFLSGWTSLTLGFGAGIAAAAMGASHYALSLLTDLVPADSSVNHAFAPNLLAVLLILGVTLPHSFSIRASTRSHLLITAVKILLIGGLFTAAFAVLGGADPSAAAPASFLTSPPERHVDFAAVGLGLVFILYAYSGWNAVNYIAEEVRTPARTIRNAMLISVALITFFYLTANTLYFAALPYEQLVAEPVLPVAKKAMDATLGASFTAVFTLALCLALLTSISAMVWVGPRVYSKMAESGLLPTALMNRTSGGSPARAIYLQSLWAIALCLTGTFEQLIVYSGLALMVFSSLAVAAALRFQPEGGDRAGWWGAVMYLLLVLPAVGLATAHQPTTALLSLLTVLAGYPLYWMMDSRCPKFLRLRRIDSPTDR